MVIKWVLRRYAESLAFIKPDSFGILLSPLLSIGGTSVHMNADHFVSRPLSDLSISVRHAASCFSLERIVLELAYVSGAITQLEAAGASEPSSLDATLIDFA